MSSTTPHVLVDAAAAAVAVSRPASTVYRWGSRGLITRRGRDDAGRWLYDLHEVERYAAAHRPPQRQQADPGNAVPSRP